MVLRHKTIVIKTVGYERRDKHIHQGNIIESPKTDPFKCRKLTFCKETKKLNGQRIVFSTNYVKTAGEGRAKMVA